MADLAQAHKVGSLNTISVIVRILLGLFLAITAFLVIGAATLMIWEASADFNYPYVWGFYRFEIGALVFLLLFGVPSALAFSLWTWRAHANLHEWGTPGLVYSPGWAAAANWVPFANLAVPMRAMRQLWNHSHGEIAELSGQSVGLVTAWWTCFVIGIFVQSLLAFIVILPIVTHIHVTNLPGANYALFCLSGIMLVLGSWNLILIVARITGAQRNLHHVGGLFD
jgi:hypothetical protein